MAYINNEAEEANLLHWDELAPVHLESYGIEDLLAGVSRIDSIQKQEFYPVAGKEVIHLQCHIGTDTLSLALDGAHVTGVDFSGKSIAIARDLAAKMRLDVKFFQGNVLDLKGIIPSTYDVVYTSKGVLPWISDIAKWAETVSSLLRPDGFLYLMDSHPFSYVFDDTRSDELIIVRPYFHQGEPIHYDDDQPDYSNGSYVPTNKTYEWTWSISDVMNALIEAGLKIEMLHEYDKAFYKALPGMVKTNDGWWMMEKHRGMIPLTFSLLARKAT